MNGIFNNIISRMMKFDSCETGRQGLVRPVSPCHLYVHVPFCETLCPYCSFHRVVFDKGAADSYFHALRDELRLYHKLGFMFSDVYVGGGTPTVCPEQLSGTLELIRSLFPVREISVETNPNGLQVEILDLLKVSGVSRLSVGVQSFDDELLKKIGRYDKYGGSEEIIRRLEFARGIFKTLNIDMIFNLPGQFRDSLKRDINILMKLGVDQVSFYPLMAAAGSKEKTLHSLGKTGGGHLHDFYKYIFNTLQPAYRASSAWCFSRNDGMIDEYIIRHDNYVGAGSGSFSYVDGTLYLATFSIEQYIARVKMGLTGITQKKTLSLKQRMQYDFMVKLFGLKLDRKHVTSKYGRKFWVMMFPEIVLLRLLGVLRNDGEFIRLTGFGMYIWVVIMKEFFNTINIFREKMRAKIPAEKPEGALTCHVVACKAG